MPGRGPARGRGPRALRVYLNYGTPAPNGATDFETHQRRLPIVEIFGYLWGMTQHRRVGSRITVRNKYITFQIDQETGRVGTLQVHRVLLGVRIRLCHGVYLYVKDTGNIFHWVNSQIYVNNECELTLNRRDTYKLLSAPENFHMRMHSMTAVQINRGVTESNWGNEQEYALLVNRDNEADVSIENSFNSDGTESELEGPTQYHMIRAEWGGRATLHMSMLGHEDSMPEQDAVSNDRREVVVAASSSEENSVTVTEFNEETVNVTEVDASVTVTEVYSQEQDGLNDEDARFIREAMARQANLREHAVLQARARGEDPNVGPQFEPVGFEDAVEIEAVNVFDANEDPTLAPVNVTATFEMTFSESQ